MINQLLTRLLGQSIRQAPKATKAARSVRVPPRSAGIGGRMGPGGGGLETGVVARPITRPSSVNVRPNNTPYTGTLQPNTSPSYVRSQGGRGFSVSPTGAALGTGALTGVGLAASEMGGGRGITGQIEGALNNVGPAIDSFVSNLNFPGQRAVEEFGRGQEQRGLGGLLDFSTGGLPMYYNTVAGFTGLPTIGQTLDRATDATAKPNLGETNVPGRNFQPGGGGGFAPLPTPPRVETNVPGRNFQPGGGGGFAPSRSSAPPSTPPRTEAPLPTREELERRAYQNEVSRVAQQADPFFRAGGAPQLTYSADEGMAISRALYGDQLTPNTPNPLMAGLVYDETNPTMQGRNYNMENPVGVEQSAAQSLADYYRNEMIEQQTQGMGAEPGLESVLSPEDREMFLGRLSNFMPGGPG